MREEDQGDQATMVDRELLLQEHSLLYAVRKGAVQRNVCTRSTGTVDSVLNVFSNGREQSPSCDSPCFWAMTLG